MMLELLLCLQFSEKMQSHCEILYEKVKILLNVFENLEIFVKKML